MRFTEENSGNEFGQLSQCIKSTMNRGEISADDAETLSFFLDIVKETLVSQNMANS